MLTEQLKLLQEQAKETQQNAYAKGTRENLLVQWATYHNFCEYFNFSVLPTQTQVLVPFIQFLTKKLPALSSIKNYVVGVRTLHQLLELPVDAFNSMPVKLMWMGLERTWKTPVM